MDNLWKVITQLVELFIHNLCNLSKRRFSTILIVFNKVCARMVMTICSFSCSITV
ncbi:hypothetical protein PAE4_10008 [Bacillus altitudinis]|nr:hypothetical protein PAE4_10008 [Bacillus altitudinis]